MVFSFRCWLWMGITWRSFPKTSSALSAWTTCRRSASRTRTSRRSTRAPSPTWRSWRRSTLPATTSHLCLHKLSRATMDCERYFSEATTLPGDFSLLAHISSWPTSRWWCRQKRYDDISSDTPCQEIHFCQISSNSNFCDGFIERLTGLVHCCHQGESRSQLKC